MSLSSDLLSQFVKITNDTKKTETETTVYGTVKYDGKYYVQLDGSELLTPVQTTTDVKDGERVSVAIKDHTATITGNLTSPSARTDDVQTVGKQISEFEIIVADKVKTDDIEAVNVVIDNLRAKLASIESLDATDLEVAYADIGELEAQIASMEYLDAGTITAVEATIEKIEVDFGNFTSVSTEDLEALNAEIATLKGYTADFTYMRAESLEAARADLKDASIKYAKIDFANIGEAAIEKLFSDSGIIETLVMSDGNVTGELVGVTISGDLIQGNTIMADRLIIKGEDGLYRQINATNGIDVSDTLTEEQLQNGIHGSVIIAKSLTADEIYVTDLVSFGATIGGFEITDTSIHTITKDSPDSSINGIYMDNDGQFSIGDGDNYIKYVKDESKTNVICYAVELADDIYTATTSIVSPVTEEIVTDAMTDTGQQVYLGTTADGEEIYFYKADTDAYKLLIATSSIADQIAEATAALEETVANVKKHFTFDSDGITITNGDNTLSLQLDAGVIRFKKNGSQFGWWDGVDFHTGNIKIEVTERAQFGNFGFVPRSDGSLSFLKLEHRTGFYTILNGTIMSIFAAYPTLENTAMVLGNGVAGELTDTTLTLTAEVD